MKKKFLSKLMALVVAVSTALSGATTFAAIENPPQNFHQNHTGGYYNILQPDFVWVTDHSGTYTGQNVSEGFETVDGIENVLTLKGQDNPLAFPYFTSSYVYMNKNNMKYVTLDYKYTATGNVSQEERVTTVLYNGGTAAMVSVPSIGDGQWHTAVLDMTSANADIINGVTVYVGADSEVQVANLCIYANNPLIAAIDAKLLAENGKAPSAYAPSAVDNFTVNSIAWTDMSGNAVETFVKGTQYKATLELAANDNYKFTQGAINFNGADSATVTSVNNDMLGNVATVEAVVTGVSVSTNPPSNIMADTNPDTVEYDNIIQDEFVQVGNGGILDGFTTVDGIPSVMKMTGNGTSFPMINGFWMYLPKENARYFTINYKYTSANLGTVATMQYNGARDFEKEFTAINDGVWHTAVVDMSSVVDNANLPAQVSSVNLYFPATGEAYVSNLQFYAKNPLLADISLGVEPIIGEALATAVETDEAIATVSWQDAQGQPAATAEPGKTYTATINVTAKDDYKIAAENITVDGAAATIVSRTGDMFKNSATLTTSYTVEPVVVENMIPDEDTALANFKAFYPDEGHAVTVDTEVNGNKRIKFDSTNTNNADVISGMYYPIELKKGHTYYYSYDLEAGEGQEHLSMTFTVDWFVQMFNRDLFIQDEATKVTGTVTMDTDRVEFTWEGKATDENGHLTHKDVYYIDNFELYDVSNAYEIAYGSTGVELDVTVDKGVVDYNNKIVYAGEGAVITATAEALDTFGKHERLEGFTKAGDKYQYVIGTNDAQIGVYYDDDVTYQIDGNQIKVTASSAGNRDIIAASYTNGSLSKVWMGAANTTAANQTVTVTAEGFENLNNVKIFCWDGIDSMKALKYDVCKMTATPTVYILGEGAAIDQESLSDRLYQGWGAYFKNMIDATVVNKSIVGAAIGDGEYTNEENYTTLMDEMKAGDYLIMALGTYNATRTDNAASAFTAGMNDVINAAKAKGVEVILVKPARTLNIAEVDYDTFLGLIDEIAQAQGLEVLDLNAVTGDMPEYMLQHEGESLTPAGADYQAAELARLLRCANTELKYYLK